MDPENIGIEITDSFTCVKFDSISNQSNHFCKYLLNGVFFSGMAFFSLPLPFCIRILAYKKVENLETNLLRCKSLQSNRK